MQNSHYLYDSVHVKFIWTAMTGDFTELFAIELIPFCCLRSLVLRFETCLHSLHAELTGVTWKFPFGCCACLDFICLAGVHCCHPFFLVGSVLYLQVIFMSWVTGYYFTYTYTWTSHFMHWLLVCIHNQVYLYTGNVKCPGVKKNIFFCCIKIFQIYPFQATEGECNSCTLML